MGIIKNLKEEVRIIKERDPLIPSDVTVYGFIIDSTTGELTRIV